MGCKLVSALSFANNKSWKRIYSNTLQFSNWKCTIVLRNCKVGLRRRIWRRVNGKYKKVRKAQSAGTRGKCSSGCHYRLRYPCLLVSLTSFSSKSRLGGRTKTITRFLESFPQISKSTGDLKVSPPFTKRKRVVREEIEVLFAWVDFKAYTAFSKWIFLLVGHKVDFIAQCGSNKSIFWPHSEKKIMCDTKKRLILLVWLLPSLCLGIKLQTRKINFFTFSSWMKRY